MANGDERGPFKLDQNRAKVLTAAGVANASEKKQQLEGAFRGTVKVDDLSKWAPVSFSPRYLVRLQSPAPVDRITYQINAAPIPYMIVYMGTLTNPYEILTQQTGFAGMAPHVARLANPAQDVAPTTLSFQSVDTVTNINTVVLDGNRWDLMELLVSPGTFVIFQGTGVGIQIDLTLLIQEFPGGVGTTPSQ